MLPTWVRYAVPGFVLPRVFSGRAVPVEPCSGWDTITIATINIMVNIRYIVMRVANGFVKAKVLIARRLSGLMVRTMAPSTGHSLILGWGWN